MLRQMKNNTSKKRSRQFWKLSRFPLNKKLPGTTGHWLEEFCLQLDVGAFSVNVYSTRHNT